MTVRFALPKSKGYLISMNLSLFVRNDKGPNLMKLYRSGWKNIKARISCKIHQLLLSHFDISLANRVYNNLRNSKIYHAVETTRIQGVVRGWRQPEREENLENLLAISSAKFKSTTIISKKKMDLSLGTKAGLIASEMHEFFFKQNLSDPLTSLP